MADDDKKRSLEEEIFGASDDEFSDLEDEKPLQLDVSKNQMDTTYGSGGIQVEMPDSIQPKKRKKRRKDTEDEDHEPSEKRKRKLKKARRREVVETQPAQPQEPQEEISEAMREFEATVASLKPKRRRQDDYDSTDLDDMMDKLQKDMVSAAEEDIQANTEDKAATSKLKMLPRVLTALEKSGWHEALLENQILDAVRIWLEPLPDGSLPALNIRRGLMDAISKMPISTEYLRTSRLGRVVMFTYKCERELPDLRKKAGELINKWCRPILARAGGRAESGLDLLRQPRLDPVSAPRSDGKERVGDRTASSRRAMIPQPMRATFHDPPQSNVDVDDYRSKSESRFKTISQSMNKSRVKVERRLNKISVQGRDKTF